MRHSLIGSVLIGLVLATATLSPAAAANVTPRAKYSACICRFGYGGDRCDAAVACYSEGGRCTQSCPAQSE